MSTFEKAVLQHASKDARSISFEFPLEIRISFGDSRIASAVIGTSALPIEVAAGEVESVPAPDFELSRAISAYIPLLDCSYKLAAQEPYQLPGGYTQLGFVRISAEEAIEDIDLSLTPEQKKAVERDREALDRGAYAGQTEAIADPGAFGFIVREDSSGSILISIRGTQTPFEWLADFTPVPIPFFESPGMGLVHVGFAVFYHKVRKTIESVLDTLDPASRITVVGHSLGGAMAVLCAADIERNMHKKNVDVCTFGGPRTGKIDFRVHFNREITKCYRVVNALDIVPHVPLVITGWNHVGKEIDVNGKGPNAHSLVAYLDGLVKLTRASATEGTDSGSRVLSMQIL
jgi:hypothetical protein